VEPPHMNEHMGTSGGRYYYVPNSYMNESERKARP